MSPRPEDHPFVTRPHRTVIALSIPVMASLAVEPLAGVVDTAFVQRLGAAPAAALGAATALLSSAIWVFNFLGIGTQTEVAHAWGERAPGRARQAASLGTALALLLGVAFALAAWPFLPTAAAWMSEDPGVRVGTEAYLRIRLLGVPPTLVVLVAFGTLRGLQDMRTPLWIAAGISAFNIGLDPVLIFGLGPLPALGIRGAAWATVLGWAAGALWALLAVTRRVGLSRRPDWRRARSLLVVGRDLVLRTGALLLFLLLATRRALEIGVDAGAAHQALRQVWILFAFLLDAYALSGQTLIGYFVAARRVDLARRVAAIACAWGLATGIVIAGSLLALERAVTLLLVPPSAVTGFASSWWACAGAQPLNAVSFVTDGIHWGARDYAYLRNAMLASTALALLGLAAIDPRQPGALLQVWLVTAAWIASRSAFGVLRIWPGTSTSPLRAAPAIR